MSKIKKSKNVISDSSISAEGNIHIGDITNNIYNVSKEESKKELTEKKVIANKGRKLIAGGKIKLAIEYLAAETENIKGDFSTQVAQQSAKWNKFKKGERMGILSSEEKDLQYNRIVNSLLEIVNELNSK